ncbi:MAG: FAD-binding oxidoreductase [Candidatus Eisenbacteria bacterium]|nr:FAD-binding oxidoreductase [Candidatus Eisenbacteria bacterium]
MRTAGAVIIGGGVVGSSIAFHLLEDGFKGGVLVVERDPTYARASSRLAMGGIRQQFGTAVNIALVQRSIPFWRSFDERMGGAGDRPRSNFRQRGYLFLVKHDQVPDFERRLKHQQQLGVRVERLGVAEVSRRLPDLALEDIAFGVFGPDDGYANPREVLRGFRAGAERAGASFVEDEVVGITRLGASGRRRVTGVRLRGGESIDSPVIVNAAGAWAARIGEMAGIELPIRPVRQHLFRCALPGRWPYRFPMVIDPTGVHWRHDDGDSGSEEDRIIVARTRHDEPVGENFACDESRWSREFLPPLLARLPRFRDLRVIEGWAGLYEMTPDANPLLGEPPTLAGFFVAAGFSGHGLMMSPAVGKALSEIIREGRATTVDVSPLAVDRFERGAPLEDAATL